MLDNIGVGVKEMNNTQNTYTEEIPPNDLRSRNKVSGLKGVNLESYLCARYLRMKENADKRNIPFSLVVDDLRELVKQEYCYFLGIPLYLYVRASELQPFDQFSIDRLDPNKGYEKDNVVACSIKANKLKSLIEYDVHTFKQIADKMCKGVEKQKGQVLEEINPLRNTSGKIGVTYHKGKGKWEARGVLVGGKQKWLGAYKSKEAAIKARELHELEVLGGVIEIKDSQAVFIKK